MYQLPSVTMGRQKGSSSASNGRHVVSIGGAEFVPPRSVAPPPSYQQADERKYGSSASSYQSHPRLFGSPLPPPPAAYAPARAHAMPAEHTYRGAGHRRYSSSMDSGATSNSPPLSSSLSSCAMAFSTMSTSAASFGTSSSPPALASMSWQAQQNLYAKALYEHTRRMWQNERRAMEAVAHGLAPDAAPPMRNSSMRGSAEVYQQVSAASSSSQSDGSGVSGGAGPRRARGVKVSKHSVSHMSQATVNGDGWLGRAKSLKRSLGIV
ncbi:hypothetical protein K437DRAFT_262234 [Tilletiaria anomala UBC 951]|uniref:Uncharacterized protein n=1 Tax=Tilletiaria anomala (strain ATCC 24038 / CBS 436.72 / UBC 951) TaxID=1037660 RepID=A0A066W7C7_TILAU|nr:uncharacterized protein K437DRAFT_262234 [Tilletiaria anomala UBC 951]KDN48428.1 hypothetical protein K437DRAFT_262234 [Tilletiaria anomala UBC 951]